MMMRYLIQFARTFLMGTIGIFLISIPFQVPQTVGWSDAILPVVCGTTILYVEFDSWRLLLRAPSSRGGLPR